MPKNETRAKRIKLLFFIVKYANLWRSCCRLRHGYLSSALSFLGATILRTHVLSILGDPGAVSRVDKMSAVKVYCNIISKRAPGHLLLPNQFQKRLNCPLLIGQKKKFFCPISEEEQPGDSDVLLQIFFSVPYYPHSANHITDLWRCRCRPCSEARYYLGFSNFKIASHVNPN